jgi:hypothetical protein
VLLLTSAEDLDCTPGFQQKVFHINQPAEFIEDQLVLNCKHCTWRCFWPRLMFKFTRVWDCLRMRCFLS